MGGYTKAQILKRFYEEILAALEQGTPLGVPAHMNEFLEAEGYEGLDPCKPTSSSAPTFKRPIKWATMSR